MINVDLIAAVKESVKFFGILRGRKIPEGQFFRRIERRYKIKLHPETKKEILWELKERGIIHIFKSDKGKKYIIFGDLDFNP